MRPMSDTKHVHTSNGSIRSSDNIQDAFRKMKVNSEESNQKLYPDRPGERDCQFYLRTGLCGYGSTCRFNHPTLLPQGAINEELPERLGQPDCEYNLKTGACKYGSTCKYHHPKDRNGAEPVLFNALRLPMRQGEKPCPYYLRTGTCRFGVACKFHHPQPDNGHSPAAAYGMSSFPYAGGLTMMSTYGALARPQVPQSYVPVMVSPSQGLLPPQSWGTYMAAASNSMYNVKTQQPYYSGSSPPMHMAVTLNGGLLERSEQPPECRVYMNTGTCKYGDGCKYNHPGVRISPPQPPPQPSFINPCILPVRPGQPACGNLKSYGFCKFGPNCRFDHSMLQHPGMGMPSSLPSPYASSTHQRISPLPSRTDSKKPDAKKKEMAETKKPEDDSQVLNSSQVSENVSSPQ